jgi:hypothetical protein
MASPVLERSSSENKQSCAAEVRRSESLVPKLARFYSVMGHRPDEPGALALMAEMLAQSATDDEISVALTRCARECKYPVRMPDILQRIPGQEVPQLEAEARKAWEVVQDFTRRYIGNDVYGNYGPEHGWYPKTFSKLSQRIGDTVRRTGGWRTYKSMTDDDYPHQQKRFFEEYAAWTAVEQIVPTRLLTEMPALKLIARPMESHKMNPRPMPISQLVTVKSVPAPPTDAQIRDRREMLRQQKEKLQRKVGIC